MRRVSAHGNQNKCNAWGRRLEARARERARAEDLRMGDEGKLTKKGKHGIHSLQLFDVTMHAAHGGGGMNF
jgi:hypothetical protein